MASLHIRSGLPGSKDIVSKKKAVSAQELLKESTLIEPEVLAPTLDQDLLLCISTAFSRDMSNPICVKQNIVKDIRHHQPSAFLKTVCVCQSP